MATPAPEMHVVGALILAAVIVVSVVVTAGGAADAAGFELAPTGSMVDMNGVKLRVTSSSGPASYAITFCPTSTTSTTRRVLGGGGIMGAPAIGDMPPDVSSSRKERMMAAPAPAPEMHFGGRHGLTTPQKLGVTAGVVGFVLLCLVVFCILRRTGNRLQQQPQPGTELTDAPRASGGTGTATPTGSEDSAQTVIVRESASSPAVNLLDVLGSPAHRVLDLDMLAASASASSPVSDDSPEHVLDILDYDSATSSSGDDNLPVVLIVLPR